MSDTLLKIQPGTVPQGTCYPATVQELNVLILSLARAIFPGTLSTFNFGNTVPTADNRDKPWIRTDASGNLDRLYTWGGGGVWVSPHPVPASSQIRFGWVGLEADLKTFDGGVDEPVSDTTGPFWEVDHDFDAKFSVGPGTFAGGTTVNVGDTGGADEKTLTSDNIPPHFHDYGIEGPSLVTSDSQAGTFHTSGTNYYDPTETTTQIGRTRQTGGTGTPAAATAFEILPPYRGEFRIRRTARIFYAV